MTGRRLSDLNLKDMKIFHTMCIIALLQSTVLLAQKPIIITDDSVTYRNLKHPGVSVTVPEVSYESFQKSWVKEMESGTKSKAVYENGEWYIFGANMKSVVPTPVNIYSKIANQDSSVRLMVSIELKKDIYIEKNSGETELAKLKNYLKKYAKERYSQVAHEQLKTEQDKLRDLERELSSYQKDESDLSRSIRSNEKTIKDEQDNLAELNEELNTLSSELATQNAQFAELTEDAAKTERAKYIKELEKRNKKLANDITSAENRISKANSEIRKANSEIPDKQKLQKEVREKINIQKPVVSRFEYKYNTIMAY